MARAKTLKEMFLRDYEIAESEKKILKKLLEEVSIFRKEITTEAKLIEHLDEEIHECFYLIKEIVDEFEKVIPVYVIINKNTKFDDAERMAKEYEEKVYPLVEKLEIKLSNLKDWRRCVEIEFHDQMKIVSTMTKQIALLDNSFSGFKDHISDNLKYLKRVMGLD